MKRSKRKIIAVLMAIAMAFSVMIMTDSTPAQAATKAQGTVNINTKKLIIPKGSTTSFKNNTLIMVKDCRYQIKAKFGKKTVASKIKYKSSDSKTVKVSKIGMITARKPGRAVIKITCKKANKTLNVKVIADHKHRLKTIVKATCNKTGKRLCKTCGAILTTAVSKHDFITYAEPTCTTDGVLMCKTCKNTKPLAKLAHEYVTRSTEEIEGGGDVYYEDLKYCAGCGINITKWTDEQIQAHQNDTEGIKNETSNPECFAAGYTGILHAEKYPTYVMTKTTVSECKNCGSTADPEVKDLYEVYYDEWRNTIRKDTNRIIQESEWYQKAKPWLEKQK